MLSVGASENKRPSWTCDTTLTYIAPGKETATVGGKSCQQLGGTQPQVLNSAGTVLGTLSTLSNVNKNAACTQKTFDLSAYKGQTIRIRWQATEDSSLQTTFAIDDTAVNVS